MEVWEVYAIAKGVYKRYFSTLGKWREDLISEGVLAILECEKKYDSDSAKFSTYVWACARGRMAHYYKRHIEKHFCSESVENIDIFRGECKSELEFDKIKGLLVANVKFRSDRKNKIIAELVNGKKQCDVANEFEVTAQYVSTVWCKWCRMVRYYYKIEDGELVQREGVVNNGRKL